MDQLHTIGSYGFPMRFCRWRETLTLRIEDQVDVEAQYPPFLWGSCAFSGVKIKKEPLFPRRALPLGNGSIWRLFFNASDVFGSSAALEELTFHLKEGAYLIFGGGALGIPLCAALCLRDGTD